MFGNAMRGILLTIGVQTKEPVLLLFVGHDADQTSGPLGVVDILKLFEENLDFLTIGGALGDEVETLPYIKSATARQMKLYIVKLTNLGIRYRLGRISLV
jgi:hypothetical protein